MNYLMRITARLALVCCLAQIGAGAKTASANDHAGHTAVAEHGHGHGHHGFLGVNWWAWDGERPPMGWFLIDFAVFAGLMVAATYKPLKNVFLQRHENIKHAVTQAAAAHAKASAAQQQARHRLTTLEQEIRELELGSLRDGEAERAQMVGTAEAYGARLRAESHLQADQEVRRAQERLRTRLLRGAIAAAQQRIADGMTAEDHTRLLGESIDHLLTAQPTVVARPQRAKQERA